jgi:MoxR-vWA-beta-propeller ternary system protein/FtsH ternary system-associated peptide
MSTGWAISLPLEHAVAASSLRLQNDVEACVTEDRLWLRGPVWSEDLNLAFKKILGCERFVRLADHQIAGLGCILPSGLLPEGPWIPFQQWLAPVLPPTLLPALAPKPCGLRLVRSGEERAANLLACDFRAWLEYCESAPQIRLNHLQFAVSDDWQALIYGSPLPPLPGTRFAEANGVAVPLGWTWIPAMDAQVLREALGMSPGDIALFTTDGQCEVIEALQFVGTTRSAARLTGEEIAHGR